MKFNSGKKFMSKDEEISNVFLFPDVFDNSNVESYDDIIKDFGENIKGKVTTKAEKLLALSYINRIIKSIASSRLKAYWENQADIINQELKLIMSDRVQLGA